jgi:hypothetical protein
MDAALSDGDPAQGAVQLAVAAAVEPVPPVLAGAGFERSHPGVAGELGIACEALDRTDLAEQLGPQRAQPGRRSSAGASERVRASSSRSSSPIERVRARQRATRSRAIRTWVVCS